MSILNYFFIGTIFTFIIDLILGWAIKSIQNHPKMKDHTWGIKERTVCILIWPIAALVFSIAFIKQLFKK
tara:strand:+ start:265 stop:474 length:210 start_codon:yes stop_codon:yes gene_type:complete